MQPLHLRAVRVAPRCLTVAIAATLAATSTAQTWTRLSFAAQPSARINPAMVYDCVRREVVTFGGKNASNFQDTWSWNGYANTWQQRSPANRPSPRHIMAFAYDIQRDKTVIFGGWDDSSLLGDTWEYNGSNWQLRSTTGPGGRCAPAMTYDSARGRVVLFGGQGTSSSFANDTWEWDGTSWSRPSAGGGASPQARYYHAMTYDVLRSRTVMFGGQDGNNHFRDTWAWNGTSWTQLSSTGPAARANHGMVYDVEKDSIVLYGGRNPITNNFGDTWSFDGASWTQVAVNGTTPSARHDHTMVYDIHGRRVLMFGGINPSGVLDEIWEYRPASTDPQVALAATPLTSAGPVPELSQHAMSTHPSEDAVVFGGKNSFGFNALTYELQSGNWVKRVSVLNPAVRTGHALVEDVARQNNLMFGGADYYGTKLADTWTYSSGQWSLQSPANAPSARSNHALAYDPINNVCMLFGGEDAVGNALGDFWRWNGTNWSQPTTSVLPGARSNHQMAWNEQQGRLLLYGGRNGANRLDDAWEYDGTNWTEASAAVIPSPRGAHGMAMDTIRGRMVVFGGGTGPTYNNETWELEYYSAAPCAESVWENISTPQAPAARISHAMAFDGTRGLTVLFGGYDPSAPAGLSSETWTYDGVSWALRTPASVPSQRWGSDLAFDAARSVCVMFGGVNSTTVHSDTWVWNGSNWSQRTPTTVPSGRWNHAMAYDAGNSRVVMFGGQNSSQDFNQTWTWNGTNWTQIATSGPAPSPRRDATMAYDPIRNEIVLFGGYNNQASLNDTWVLRGNAWTQLAPANAPSPRFAQMEYDPRRGKIVLFGGTPYSQGTFGAAYSDTWEWDGTDWAPAALERADGIWNPGPRVDFAMAYDRASERIALMGGQNAGGCLDDVWSWNGVRWTRHAIPTTTPPSPAPSARKEAAMTSDPSAGLLLFGGECGSSYFNDLWRLELPIAARVDYFGTGCGNPELQFRTNPQTPPILGTTAEIELSGRPLGIAFAAMGYNTTSYAGIPLPLDLSAYGWPGCWLYQSTDTTDFFLLAGAPTSTVRTRTLPNDPNLLGFIVYQQAFAQDVNNFSLLYSSRAMEWKLGVF